MTNTIKQKPKKRTSSHAQKTTHEKKKRPAESEPQKPTPKADEQQPVLTTETMDAKTADGQAQEECLSTKIPFIKPSQIDLAITTLVDHSNKTISQKSTDGQLFADQVGSNQSFFNLVITLKRIVSRPQHKPIKISLAHPLYDPRISSVCLIVKDPQREYKDLLEEKSVQFISKVVGLTKLKSKHSSNEARRSLLHSHALFLADDRVVPLLPRILGVKFFKSNRLPLPVDLTNPDRIKAELEQAVSHSSLRISAGSCLTIKFADLSRHNLQEIRQNLIRVLEQLGKKIPLGGWTNIQSVHIKTGTSTSLPIWVAELGQDSPFSRFHANLTAQELEKVQAAKKKRDEIKEKREANKKNIKRSKISNKIKL